MKSYHIMVTSYGHANIVADSEEEALAAVNSMDERDFDWDHGFSADDASIVDEEEIEDEDEEKEETFYVTIEKAARKHMTVEAVDLDSAITKIETYIYEQDDDEFTYDYAICDENGRTLVDWAD